MEFARRERESRPVSWRRCPRFISVGSSWVGFAWPVASRLTANGDSVLELGVELKETALRHGTKRGTTVEVGAEPWSRSRW